MLGFSRLFRKPQSIYKVIPDLPPLTVDYGRDFIALAVDTLAGGFYTGESDAKVVTFPPARISGVVTYEAKLLYFKPIFSFDRVVEAIHAIDMSNPVMWEPANVEQLLVFLEKHWIDVMCERVIDTILALGTTSAHFDDPLVPGLFINVSYNTGFPVKRGLAWFRKNLACNEGIYFLATRPVQKQTGV